MHDLGIIAHCRACRHEKELDLRAMIEAMGPAYPTLKIAEALLCVGCGARGAALLIPVVKPKRRPIQGAFGGAYNDLPG